MSAIKIKIRRFFYKVKHGFFAIENIVLVIAVLLCSVWTYKSIASMTRNWELSEKLNSEKKELELLEIEVEAAELENAYYNTEEYKELSARRFANKQLPGEHMVYLPPNTDTAKNKHKKVTNQVTSQEKSYSNFEKWMLFLFPNNS